MIEKGHYIKAKDLPLLEKHAMSTMYERGGTMSTHDLGKFAILQSINTKNAAVTLYAAVTSLRRRAWM